MPKKKSHKVARQIASYIESEHCMPHSRLPSENDLSLMNNCNRLTTSRALKQLMYEGMVYNIPNEKGWYVSPRRYKQSLWQLNSFIESLKEAGCKVTNQLISSGFFPANKTVAKLLRIPLAASVFVLSQLYYINSEPMIIKTNYISKDLVPNIENYDFIEKPFFKAVEDNFKIKYELAEEEIEIVFPNENEAKLLSMSITKPVFLLKSISYERSGRPIEYSVQIACGERFLYESILI